MYMMSALLVAGAVLLLLLLSMAPGGQAGKNLRERHTQ
jgi:hypothetical protein